MPQTIYQNVDGVDDILRDRGAGARIEIQRDTTSAFAAPTSLTNVTLLAGQTSYEIYDPAGSAGNWYRIRVTTAAGTQPSVWAVQQAEAPTAYATVDALREVLKLPDNSHDNQLQDLLLQVSKRITTSLGFDFFRHPAVTGTEVRTYDGDGASRIHVQQGILSLTGVSLAVGVGQSYTALVTADWKLRNPVQDGGPYTSLELTSYGQWRYYYWGHDTIQLTGVFGYAAIPDDVVRATLMWAGDLFRLGAGGGSPLSATGEEFGTETRFLGGMPRFTWETVEDYRARHNGALVA